MANRSDIHPFPGKRDSSGVGVEPCFMPLKGKQTNRKLWLYGHEHAASALASDWDWLEFDCRILFCATCKTIDLEGSLVLTHTHTPIPEERHAHLSS